MTEWWEEPRYSGISAQAWFRGFTEGMRACFDDLHSMGVLSDAEWESHLALAANPVWCCPACGGHVLIAIEPDDPDYHPGRALCDTCDKVVAVDFDLTCSAP
jgi:hypothetical protein